MAPRSSFRRRLPRFLRGPGSFVQRADGGHGERRSSEGKAQGQTEEEDGGVRAVRRGVRSCTPEGQGVMSGIVAVARRRNGAAVGRRALDLLRHHDDWAVLEVAAGDMWTGATGRPGSCDAAVGEQGAELSVAVCGRVVNTAQVAASLELPSRAARRGVPGRLYTLGAARAAGLRRRLRLRAVRRAARANGGRHGPIGCVPPARGAPGRRRADRH